MESKFRGSGVALITPFNADGTIDFGALEKLVGYHHSNGTDFLVVLGTTAETATLSTEERKQVVDCVIAKNNKKLPIVVGMGGNNTAQVVEAIKETDFTGIDAILSVTPYYNKPTQEGLFQHFMAIGEATPVPVILYNVPSRTGTNMKAETTLRLANASKKFIAVKEASGDLGQITDILKHRPVGFLVLSGDDGLVVPTLSLGADGLISVLANALPKETSQMVHAALNSDFKTASQLHQQLSELIDALFEEGNPGGVKALMHQQQLIENELRLPLCKVSDRLYQKIEQLCPAI